MREICSFLNVDFDSAMVTEEENQNDEKQYVKSQLDVSKIDSYKSKLTK